MLVLDAMADIVRVSLFAVMVSPTLKVFVNNVLVPVTVVEAAVTEASPVPVVAWAT